MKKYLTILTLLILFSFTYSQDENKGNCEIVFSFELQDNQLSYFSHKIINGVDRVVSYFWDFGDGYTSQMANPEHVFLNEGEYITCLTVTFENNCVATYCDTIVVQNSLLEPNQNFGISGYIYAGNALLPDGIVVLFRKINNSFRAVSYTKVHQGYYAFTNLTPSQYWLYAIPYFNVNTLYYPNYFPTYFGNKLLWQDAVPITVTGMHNDKNINLLCSQEFFIGNDSVSGVVHISDSTYFEYNVYLNNWFDNSLPPQDNLNLAPNQVILLYDEKNSVQRFALTNHYGQFLFKNIPRQIVKLKPEKFGLTSQFFSMDISQQQHIEFTLNENSIVIQVQELYATSLSWLNVFPNPADSYVCLRLDSQQTSGDIIIELMSISGKKIYYQQFNHNSNDSYLVPLNHLPAGAYIISVRNSQFTGKKVILKH